MTLKSIAKKVLLSLVALAVILGIAAFWLWYKYVGPQRYAEFNDIKERFQEMPDVELLDSGGHEDLTFEDIWATIRVEGKGEIKFYGLTRESFEEPKHILVNAIGPYNISFEGEGFRGVIKTATGEPVRSRFWGGSINVGPNGRFTAFFPFEMRNVLDVIAHYHDICAVLAEWPVAPEKNHFKDEEGTDYYYYVKMIQTENQKSVSDSVPVHKDSDSLSF